MSKNFHNTPKGTNVHRLWREYLKHFKVFEELLAISQDGSIDDHYKARYIATIIEKELGQHRVAGRVPLGEYCAITGVNYNTIIGRMNNKCMTVDEAIAYGHHKKQQQEENSIYAKRIKQRQHMLAIIDHLANQVVDDDGKETN